MKKYIKSLGIAGLVIGLFLGANIVSAVSPCAVPMGCTGRATITGIPYGTGTANLGIVTIGTGLTFSAGTLSNNNAGTVTSVSGTTNRITSTGGATPVIDISASYVGQSSITTLGTIGTGIWQGNPVGTLYGGTGGSSPSITLFNNITGYTASGATGTTSTNLVFSTSPSLTTPNIGSATASGLTLSAITGSNQCLHVNSSGVLSGTGSDCGAGASLTIGTTSIASGTTGRVLYDNAGTLGEMTNTGTGTVNVLQASPTLTTPVLGVATATSINKLTITAPASGSTLTIVDGKTLTVSHTITLTSAGDSSVITLPNATVSFASPGTSGNVLTSDGTNWTSAAPAGGVSSVTSANADIGVANTTTTPVLTLNSGTSASQIVKLDGSAKLPAVDGSQLTNLPASKYSVNADETVSGQITTQINMPFSASQAPWTTSGVTFAANAGDGASYTGIGTPALSGIALLAGTSSSATTLTYDVGKNLRLKWNVTIGTALASGKKYGWGISNSVSNLFDETALGISAVRFSVNNAALYAVASNGATVTASADISSGITLTNNNIYEIVFNSGSNALFYVNGVLKATLTTNLPTTGNAEISFATSGTTGIVLNHATFSRNE